MVRSHPNDKRGAGRLLGTGNDGLTLSDKNFPKENASRNIALWFKTDLRPHPQVPFYYGQPTSGSEVYVVIYENEHVVTLGE